MSSKVEGLCTDLNKAKARQNKAKAKATVCKAKAKIFGLKPRPMPRPSITD